MFKDNTQFLFFSWFLFLLYSEIIPWSLLKKKKKPEWQSFDTKFGQSFVP